MPMSMGDPKQYPFSAGKTSTFRPSCNVIRRRNGNRHCPGDPEDPLGEASMPSYKKR